MEGGRQLGDWWFVACGLWLVVCGLWFVVCGLWFVACESQLTKAPNVSSQITNHQPRASSHQPQATSHKPPATKHPSLDIRLFSHSDPVAARDVHSAGAVNRLRKPKSTAARDDRASGGSATSPSGAL